MSQNGKNMTAVEFAAWMESKGVHVARGAAPAPVPVVPVDPSMPVVPAPATPAPASPSTNP
jgi:hypothetical protein